MLLCLRSFAINACHGVGLNRRERFWTAEKVNVADGRCGGNEHSADVTALGVVLLKGLQSNAFQQAAAGVAMRFTARLGYTADLSGGVQFAWFVRARKCYNLSLCAAMSCMGIPAQSGTVHIRAFPCQGITVLCSECRHDRFTVSGACPEELTCRCKARSSWPRRLDPVQPDA